MSSRCWAPRCVFMANFGISSLRRSCSVGLDVSCSGFMEPGSMRSLGLLPMASSKGVLPHKVTWVFVTVTALRINWAGVIWDRVDSSRLLEAVSTSAERNFLNNRTPISPRFGQGVCGPVGSLLYCAFDRNACMSWGWWKAVTAQFAFGFIWKASIHSWSSEVTSDGEVLSHGHAVTCVAPSKIRNAKVLYPIIVDQWSKFFSSWSAHARSVRSRLRWLTEWACFVQHAGKDHKPFQECPSKFSSSWTAQWTCGCVSDEGPSDFAHQSTYLWCCEELHRLDFCPMWALLLIVHASFLAHLVWEVWIWPQSHTPRFVWSAQESPDPAKSAGKQVSRRWSKIRKSETKRRNDNQATRTNAHAQPWMIWPWCARWHNTT